MSYKLNKRGKLLVTIISFIVTYIFTNMLIDSFLSEQEQIREKSRHLREQVESMKN